MILKVTQDAGAIIDIDFKSEIDNIQKKVSVISSDMNDLFRKDLVTSMHRMQISNSLIKTRAEMWTDCWNGRTTAMSIEMMFCSVSGPCTSMCCSSNYIV